MNAKPKKHRGRGRPRAQDEPAFDREQVLRVALRRFARQGYEETSLRDIADEVGISHSLIGHHFGSKRQLWNECIDSSFGRLNRDLLERLTSVTEAPDLVSGLRELIVRYVILSAEYPENLLVILREGSSGGERLDYILEHHMRTFVELGRSMIERAQAEGALRPIAWPSLFFLIWSGASSPFLLSPMIRGLGAEPSTSPTAVRRHAESIADVILDGLRLP